MMISMLSWSKWLLIVIATSQIACSPLPPKGQAKRAMGTSDAVPIATLAPRYPAAAAASGTEGGVCFHLTIDGKGGVSQATIYRSVPQGVFDEDAKRAITKWKFKPKYVDGKPAVTENAKYCLEFKMPAN